MFPYQSFLFFPHHEQVFSAFGPVQKIAMFDKNGGVQALIQYLGRQKPYLLFDMRKSHIFFSKTFLKNLDCE